MCTCAGGVNVTYLLTDLLELRRPGGCATPAARGFLPLLAESECAFEELFVLSESLSTLPFCSCCRSLCRLPACEARCQRSCRVRPLRECTPRRPAAGAA